MLEMVAFDAFCCILAGVLLVLWLWLFQELEVSFKKESGKKKRESMTTPLVVIYTSFTASLCPYVYSDPAGK